jgi:hypothetical protein
MDEVERASCIEEAPERPIGGQRVDFKKSAVSDQRNFSKGVEREGSIL